MKAARKAPSKGHLYDHLPSVDELLRREELAPLISREGQAAVTDAARAVLARLRQQISTRHLDRDTLDQAISAIAGAIDQQLGDSLRYSLRPVINATGVILHTNLGRAPLAPSALEHIRETAGSYCNLELDLASGERGKRDDHVDRLFRQLLGPVNQSELATIVVNNNAAAVLLALNTLAEGGEVIVSRGEMVEIGESFRIPDIMAKSHAILREVGSTNRTRLADYDRAINDKTRLLLRVHRSNFQITGFTEQPQLEELVRLAAKHELPLMEDLGSGALFDLRSVGVNGEPDVLDSLKRGVQVVTYSGDKLLGGPQAGILSGRADLIARMRANSLFRALRADKLTYAALEATLRAYAKREYDAIPALRMMRASAATIAQRAEAVAAKIQAAGLAVELMAGESVIGGGAAPSATLPTHLLAVTAAGLSAGELAARLRETDPPILARVGYDRVLLDLRTVFPEQDDDVTKALARLASM